MHFLGSDQMFILIKFCSSFDQTVLNVLLKGGCVDESQACDGVKPLCREDKYIDTLQTYCRATCEFCKPNENNDAAQPGTYKNHFNPKF